SSVRPRTECSSPAGPGTGPSASGAVTTGTRVSSQTVPAWSVNMGTSVGGPALRAAQPVRHLADGREIEQPEGEEQPPADGPDEGQPPAGGAAAGRLQALHDPAEDVHHGRPDAGEDDEVDQQDEPADRDGDGEKPVDGDGSHQGQAAPAGGHQGR